MSKTEIFLPGPAALPSTTELLSVSSNNPNRSSLMNLVAVWEHVPRLLAACVCDEIPALRNQRLVSKESSRVSLLGLRSYTLTLRGLDAYQTICGARLLRQTRLESLSVQLNLSGSYNPSVMLEGFVRQAGIGLNTVTNLVLRLEDTSGRTMSADILSEAIAVLVTACPVLRTLSFQGHLSSALMRCLGEACPQLSTLILVGSCSRDLTYLQDTLLKSQPTLLPQLRSLTFLDCKPDFYSQLPDMSNNDSITSCSLPGCTLDSVADWLCLPRHLRHLRVGSIEEGPPGLAGGGSLLSCLVSVQTEGRWRLRPLAKLLRAAPSLTDLKLSPEIASRHFAAPRILIKLKETTSDSSSSDLSLLQHMMHVHSSLGDAHYTLFIAKREVQDQAGTRSYLANLPCMTGIKKVDFRGVEPSELGPLLNLFPNVMKLGLLYMNEIDDVELQSVAACGKLAHLDITACQRVSSVGLLSLCLLRPTLQRVVCHDCAKLSRSAITVCEQLLRKHGLQTRIGDTVEV